MPITDEYVETAFIDEYARLKQAGVDKLVEQRIDKLLFLMYRRGYIRGHSDRSREVLREEEQAIREGRTMGLDLKYEDDRLILSSGRDITPNREPAPDPPPAFLPSHPSLRTGED